jgi:hypothetical protein
MVLRRRERTSRDLYDGVLTGVRVHWGIGLTIVVGCSDSGVFDTRHTIKALYCSHFPGSDLYLSSYM